MWRRTPGLGLSSADERGPFATFLARNPTTCLAAEIDGELVGTLVAGHDGRRGYLYHLAVAPEHRRRGIGSELVHLVLERMSDCGVRKCHIMVYSDNADGRVFWQKSGWTYRSGISTYSIELD